MPQSCIVNGSRSLAMRAMASTALALQLMMPWPMAAVNSTAVMVDGLSPINLVSVSSGSSTFSALERCCLMSETVA